MCGISAGDVEEEAEVFVGEFSGLFWSRGFGFVVFEFVSGFVEEVWACSVLGRLGLERVFGFGWAYGEEVLDAEEVD